MSSLNLAVSVNARWGHTEAIRVSGESVETAREALREQVKIQSGLHVYMKVQR